MESGDLDLNQLCQNAVSFPLYPQQPAAASCVGSCLGLRVRDPGLSLLHDLPAQISLLVQHDGHWV